MVNYTITHGEKISYSKVVGNYKNISVNLDFDSNYLFNYL